MQINESDLCDEEIKENSPINRPIEMKFSSNCLLANKGHVRDEDRQRFSNFCKSGQVYLVKNLDKEDPHLTFMIGQINLNNEFSTKTPKSFEALKIYHKSDDNCNSLEEVKVKMNCEYSCRSREYFKKRRLSSRFILEQMLL